MNFERGKDPKEAMGIGIKETMPELKKMYSELRADLEEFRHMHLPDYEDAIKDLFESRPRRLVIECGWANMNEIFEKLTAEEYGPIYTLIEKHWNIIVNN
jgi:hypothetical protein